MPVGIDSPDNGIRKSSFAVLLLNCHKSRCPGLLSSFAYSMCWRRPLPPQLQLDIWA